MELFNSVLLEFQISSGHTQIQRAFWFLAICKLASALGSWEARTAIDQNIKRLNKCKAVKHVQLRTCSTKLLNYKVDLSQEKTTFVVDIHFSGL